jgi:hypothetical protein
MNLMKTTFCILLLGALPASAGSLALVMRGDSDSAHFNEAASAASATNTDSTRYYLQTARLDYKGQMNENLSFQARIRFEGVTSTTPNKTDNVTDTVDIMQVTHRLGEGMSVTLGKVATEILADDGIPLSDVYLTSRARADIAAAYLYVTGIKFAKSFDDQEVKVMTFNQSETTSGEQTKSAYGIIYKGKFMDKTLLPTVSYHKDNRQATTVAGDQTVEMWAAGLKYDPKPYAISLDYLQNTRDNMTGTGVNAVAASSKKNIIGSYVLDGSYQFDPQWLLKLRLDLSRKTAENNAAHNEAVSNYEGISVATEFKPFKDDMFRYHLAWTQLTEKPQTGADQITQHLIVGAMIYADFLK